MLYCKKVKEKICFPKNTEAKNLQQVVLPPHGLLVPWFNGYDISKNCRALILKSYSTYGELVFQYY